MQIRIEQTLADLQAYIDAPTSQPVTKNQLSAPQKQQKSAIKKSTANPAKFLIQQALNKPIPRPIVPILESGSLAPIQGVKRPNFAEMAARSIQAAKPLPNPQLERLKQLGEYQNPHSFYSPLNRYRDQDPYNDVTVKDIQDHGMYNLQLRRELPQDVDLSPVMALPGEDGRQVLGAHQISAEKLKTLEKLEQSPHQRAFAEAFNVKTQDQEDVQREVENEIKIKNLKPVVELQNDDLMEEELIYQEEESEGDEGGKIGVQHWTQINHKRNYRTGEINKIMDMFQEQQDETGLKSCFQDRILFFDATDNFNIIISDKEIIKNVVYKSLFQRFAFAASEISYILKRIILLVDFDNGFIVGEQLIQLGVDMYFNGVDPKDHDLKEIIVEKIVDNSAEEQRKIEQNKLRQQQVEQERARKDAELRKKLAAAFIIQNFYKFIQCKESFINVMQQKSQQLEQNFEKTQERFLVDNLPYYNRLSNHLQENQHNLQMSLFNSIDLPLLDIEFWYDHSDQQADQKILIFMYVTDDQVYIPELLGVQRQIDTILDDKFLTILIDPRVHLCVISTNDVKIPETAIFNACDAIHKKQGYAVQRLHIININTQDKVDQLEKLKVKVPQLFILQLKNNLNLLADQMQGLIDKLQPDIVFQTLTTEQQLSSRLVQVLKETRLPIHQVCFELMNFSDLISQLNETAQKTLLKFRKLNTQLNIDEQIEKYSKNENFIAPTYLLRPDTMVTAPGSDLVYNQLGGIGIGHYFNNTQFQVFQNINNTKFFSKYGLVLHPYYSENQIYRYLSFNMTINGQIPRFNYIEQSAKSYIKFGHTMSAGSFSPVEQSFWRLVPKEAFDNFLYQLIQTLKRFNYRGTFDCSIVLLKIGQNFQFELNQLTFGYSPRYLSHNRTVLLKSYSCQIQDRVIDISKNFYFMNGLRNQFYKNLRKELKLIKVNQVYISFTQNFALDVVVEGATEKQMWDYANEFMTEIQGKSGGEAFMRQLLLDQAGQPLHIVQSEIEKTGTAPFYVCGVNSAQDQ